MIKKRICNDIIKILQNSNEDFSYDSMKPIIIRKIMKYRDEDAKDGGE